MQTLRKAEDRGPANLGWLDSRHSFSFGHYYDPNHMGFRALRVINEDRVVAGAGFDTHGHKDMEIISYVIEGALEHKDTIGTHSKIVAGEVQRMSAGTGILHSEFNASKVDPVHFLQIWILPEKDGIEPSYEQALFSREDKLGRLAPLVSDKGIDGALHIHQDVTLYASILETGQSVIHAPEKGRHTWVQVVRGTVSVNGVTLAAGDGLAISGEDRVAVSGGEEEGEFLLFDLA
ncbi:MAG: pirin family protein [Magnetovibrionaceae bacterium]